MGGGGGAGGLEPPHITTCPYYNHNSKCLCVRSCAQENGHL